MSDTHTNGPGIDRIIKRAPYTGRGNVITGKPRHVSSTEYRQMEVDRLQNELETCDECKTNTREGHSSFCTQCLDG